MTLRMVPRGFLHVSRKWKTTVKIGIVAAFGKETKPLRAMLQEIKRETADNYVFFIFQHGEVEVVVVKTGSGTACGAEGTGHLIEQFHPDVIFNCGVAGAISPELQIGDVVISRRVIEYDAIEDNDRKNTIYHTNENLLQFALQVSKETVPHGKIVAGDILSGDRVIQEAAHRADLWRRFHGECVEQEGAGVAKSCVSHNLPWIIIRGISDRADEHTLNDFQKNVGQAAQNAALVTFNIMNRIVKNPSLTRM